MSMKQVPITCPGHTRPVVDLDFSDVTPDGYFLISACKDGFAMLRQGDTGDWIGTFQGHKGAVWGATLNREATRAATGAADFEAKVWNTATGNELYSFSHQHIVKSIRFSHCKNLLLTGSQEKLVRVFDLNKPEADPQVYKGHTDYLKKVIWSADDMKLITACDDKFVRILDKASGKIIRAIELPAIPEDLEIDPNNRLLTVPFGKKIGFWNINTFELELELEFPTQMHSVSMHSNGKTFVCGGENNLLYKYSYPDGIEQAAYKNHFGPIHCVRFSPDGQLYASGSEDGTLRLWQTNVGSNYGLWKCIDNEDSEVKTEA